MNRKNVVRRALGVLVLLGLITALAPAPVSNADGPYRISGRITDGGGGGVSGVVEYPEPMLVTAEVFNESRGDLITGAGVSAKVTAPDNNVSSMTFRDNGQAPDEQANDGIYSALVAYDQGGEYTIQVTFDNNNGQAKYTSLAYSPSVGSNGEMPDMSLEPVGENFEVVVETNFRVDGWKADDHGNSSATATALATDNEDVAGQIDYAGDVDWFKITPSASSQLVLRVSDLAFGMDPVVEVLDGDATNLMDRLSSQDRSDSATSYPFTILEAQAGDPIYVKVSHEDSGAAAGFYRVSVGETLGSGAEPEPSQARLYLPLLLSMALNTPSSPSPADGSTGQSLYVELIWSCGHPAGDDVTYDVYFEVDDSNPDVLVSNDQSATSYDPGALTADTHYYWKIVATDEHGASTIGPVWDFTTGSSGVVPGEIVLVPAGSFKMGCDPANNGGYSCWSDTLPLHTVYLNAYTIGKYEVTNAEYAAFLNTKGNQEEGGKTWLNADDPHVRIHCCPGPWQADTGYEDHPVVEVTWYGARAYCQWLGQHLPTEAEWEKAARGAADTRIYPWGDSSFSCTLANAFNFSTMKACVGHTTPVGSYPSGASPYGAMDMSGNVFEWVNDWYLSTYYSSSPVGNPPGPASGKYKVLRGGSFGSYSTDSTVKYRNSDYLVTSYHTYGFRCAGSPSR